MGYRLSRRPAAAGGTSASASAAGITPAELARRDVANRNRRNHTGRQPIDTVEGLATALDAKPDDNDLRTLAQECLDRSNHNGSQQIGTIVGLTDVLANKADRIDLHTPVTLHPASDPGLQIDGQQLRYTAPEIPPPAPPIEVYAQAVADLAEVTEPQFGVIYVVAGQGSFLLNREGTEWIQLAALPAQ
jgi:hypothetical protein